MAVLIGYLKCTIGRIQYCLIYFSNTLYLSVFLVCMPYISLSGWKMVKHVKYVDTIATANPASMIWHHNLLGDGLGRS